MRNVVAPPPATPIEPVTEVLHGVEITDPYRWLEDQNSPRTRQWIEEQTAYTRAYLGAIPGRDRIRKRVAELLAGKDVISDPWNVGDRYFFLKRQKGRAQPVIAVRDGLFGDETILVDPESREDNTSTTVAIAAISEDGRFLAYSVRQGGSDHAAIEILDIERNTVPLSDSLPNGLCSGFAFAPDGSGFYYCHRKSHDPRPDYQAVRWHRFGSDHSADPEIFFAGEKPNVLITILQSVENKLLAYVVYSTGKLRRASMYLHSMDSGASAPELLIDNLEASFEPFFVRGRLLAYTDFGAPNFRIVHVDLADPEPAQWRDIVPESERRIQQFCEAGDRLFLTVVDRFSTTIQSFALDGRTVEHPSAAPYGSITLLNHTRKSDKLFHSYTSICKPTTVYCYDTTTGDTSVWDETSIPFDPTLIATEEVVYKSKDGTLVPLLLAARQDLLHSGPLPTFLTGYGGFGICVTPQFTVFTTVLIEHGFLFAVPAVRGGSELGEAWHLAARREKRQNSFDDFAAAAEWLVSTGRSAAGRIAIGGGSNAGLLVGAAITQRPDLFKAAICLGPLLDMTRYHLFDFAAGWADEYGSADDEQDFRCLLAYSPYHNIHSDVRYPGVLLISGDADTRCNPMHARKMAARLQAANRLDHPILLDYKADWGHMPVQPLLTKIEALTDRLAFICQELRVHVGTRRVS